MHWPRVPVSSDSLSATQQTTPIADRVANSSQVPTGFSVSRMVDQPAVGRGERRRTLRMHWAAASAELLDLWGGVLDTQMADDNAGDDSVAALFFSPAEESQLRINRDKSGVRQLCRFVWTFTPVLPV